MPSSRRLPLGCNSRPIVRAMEKEGFRPKAVFFLQGLPPGSIMPSVFNPYPSACGYTNFEPTAYKGEPRLDGGEQTLLERGA